MDQSRGGISRENGSDKDPGHALRQGLKAGNQVIEGGVAGQRRVHDQGLVPVAAVKPAQGLAEVVALMHLAEIG